MSSLYPDVVTKLGYNCDAWLVGSAADPANNTPRDYDILVPFYMWHIACLCIPKDATPNSFGGWKFVEKGVQFDLWPGELSWLAQQNKFKYAYHIKSNTRIIKENNG